MSSDDITHKKQILLALKRRLHERELQAANYGLNTDPIINIEIEDIKKKIEEIENIPEDSKEISLSTTNNQIDLVKSKDIEVFGNENNHFNLTGAWEIEEKYEHGIRTADVY